MILKAHEEVPEPKLGREIGKEAEIMNETQVCVSAVSVSKHEGV